MACGMHDCVSTGRGCNDALFTLTFDVSDLRSLNHIGKGSRAAPGSLKRQAGANRERRMLYGFVG